MYAKSTTGKRDNDKVDVQCDLCGRHYTVLLISAKRSLKKHNKHVCRACGYSLRKPLPQNTKEFWTEGKREAHSIAVRSSEAYYTALPGRDLSGPANGMFGKQHSDATKRKMSASRTGKTGANATAWKGGKTSVTRRVKGLLHTRHNWYQRVYNRDNWRCCVCESKKNLDAHHIEPLSVIIKRYLTDAPEGDPVEYLILVKEVFDPNLENGITLCRKCHTHVHTNWGSHDPQTLKDRIWIKQT